MLLVPSARAWENICSHPQISSNAVSLLPNDPELMNYLGAIRSGATNEDSPDLAVFDHFCDPRNRNDLYVPNDFVTEPIIQGAALFATGSPQTDALSRGGGYFKLAVGKYSGTFGFSICAMGYRADSAAKQHDADLPGDCPFARDRRTWPA